MCRLVSARPPVTGGEDTARDHQMLPPLNAKPRLLVPCHESVSPCRSCQGNGEEHTTTNPKLAASPRRNSPPCVFSCSLDAEAPPSSDCLRRGVLLHNRPDLLLVRNLVFLEQVERVGLRGRLGIRLVEQRLNAQQDLLDGDGGLPALILVQDGQADSAGGVDVGVEERGREFALWRLRGVLCRGVSRALLRMTFASERCGADGLNVPSGNVTSSLNRPPSHIVFSLPGTPTSHFLRSIMPCELRAGLAKKPNGWSRRHCFLRSVSSVSCGYDCEPLTSPPRAGSCTATSS
jgi:hypothetical protein